MRGLHEGIIYRMVDHRNSQKCSCAREQQNIQKVLLRKQRQGFLLAAALMFLVTHNFFECAFDCGAGHAPRSDFVVCRFYFVPRSVLSIYLPITSNKTSRARDR